MAIAFNGAANGGNNGGSTSSLTYSYTCGAGANRLLVVAVDGDTSVDDVTGATYAGAAMTLAAKQAPLSGNRWLYLFFLLNPASGANNVVVSASSSHYLLSCAADYTGVGSAGQPDATTTQQGGASIATLTTSITTVADNSWTILAVSNFFDSGGSPPSAGAGVTRRAFDAAFGVLGLFDSNSSVHPAGAYSMTTNQITSGTTICHAVASFSPPGAATPGLKRSASMSGLGASGPFFHDPLA